MRRNTKAVRAWRNAAMLSTIGLTLVVATAVGFGIGYALDRWLHTFPWLMMLFTIVGIVAGFVEMIRAVNRFNEDEERDTD